jgi:peptidoglycan/LPS O-acetylase OafA/YrhL
MGLLRVLLAISVLLSHSSKRFAFVGGPLAVEAFFMISGFYISLILNEKYVTQKNAYWLFISNRFLRIYPLYWLILVLSIMLALFIPGYNNKALIGNAYAFNTYGNNLNLFTWAYLIITQAIILFQDFILFLGVNIKNGALYFTSDFGFTNPKLFKFAFIPQAWSIALELYFYLMAPFLVRRKIWVISLIILLSFALKYIGSTQHLDHDPWSYRFFPFELGYFLAGALAYHLYKKYLQHALVSPIVNYLMYGGLALFTVSFHYLHFTFKAQIYLLAVFVCIPFLFKYTKSFKFDRFIGELSYPLYISHILVINLCHALFGSANAPLTLLGSMLISLLLNKLVSDRIEKLRQSRVSLA